MKFFPSSGRFYSQLLFCSTIFAIPPTTLNPLDLNRSTSPLDKSKYRRTLNTRDPNLIVEIYLGDQILSQSIVKSVIALAEDGIESHDATETMDEAEIGFSYSDPSRHERAFFYFRPNANPGSGKRPLLGTKWGNWSDALDTIATFTASEAENQTFNFSVISTKPPTIGGYGKLVRLSV